MLAAIGHPPHSPESFRRHLPAITTRTGPTRRRVRTVNGRGTAGLAQDTLNRAIRRDTNALAAVNTLPRNFPVFIEVDGAELTKPSRPVSSTGMHQTDYQLCRSSGPSKKTSRTSRSRAYHDRRLCTTLQGGSLRNYLGLKAHAGAMKLPAPASVFSS